MRSYIKNSSMPQSSDSSVSLDEVTNVEKNVYSLLKGARAIAGPSSEIPKVDDTEQNKIKKNFRKSIIKRAVHPNFVSSTPFHLKKTGTRNSFENISSISDIDTENNSCRNNKTLAIVEENDCEENDQPKQKNVSKDLTVLPDHIENPCQNESMRNNSKNTSANIEFLNEISLGNAKNQTIPTVSERNQGESKNRAEISKHLDEILGLTSKKNVDESEIKEKTIVEKSKVVDKHESPQKRITASIEYREDDHEQTLGRGESKIIIEHSTTDYDEETSKTKQKPNEKKIIEKHNDTRKSHTSQILLEDAESSNFEILSRSKRKVSPIRQKQDNQILKEYSDSSPRKRIRIIEKTGKGISSSTMKVSSIKSKYSGKKRYDSNEESSAIENKSKEETFRSIKRKKHSSDEAGSELNEERPGRSIKVIRKLEKSKHFVNEEYSEPEIETDNRNEKPEQRRNKQVHKRAKSRTFRRKEYRSDEESEEKHEKRGKKEVLKRGKSYGRIEYSSNEEDAELSYVRIRRRSKSQHKPARTYNEKDNSSDEESIYEVVKIKGQSVVRKSADPKHYNKKMYPAYDDYENRDYERRENRVIQERIRGRSSNRRIFEGTEYGREYNEKGKIKTRKTLQKRPKSLMRIVYESADDSPELIEHNKNARKTFTKADSSRFIQRKMYYKPDSNNDSNEEQEAVRKKIILKRQPSKSHKRKDHYYPKIPSDSDELSEDSNSYEEVQNGRHSKKVLYVVEDDSTVDERMNNSKKEKKNYKYVDLHDEKLRKKFKKPHSENVRYPSKVKSKKHLKPVIVDDSDAVEDFIRIPKSKIYSTHQEPKELDIIRPSSSKQTAVLKDINESLSPKSKHSVLLKKHGRLSRRDSYILVKQTKEKRGRSEIEQHDDLYVPSEDINSDNLATPVNQKIMPPQLGMHTIIREVLKAQQEMNNKAKEHPATDITIKETDNMQDRRNEETVSNKVIVANVNNKDEQIETNDTSGNVTGNLLVKSQRRDAVDQVLKSLLLGKQFDEICEEGQRIESNPNHNMSITSLQESISALNFAKKGDLPYFKPSPMLSPIQRLARKPYSYFDSNSISLANNTTRQPIKVKKNISEVIRFLKEESTKKNRKTMNVSIQTSLSENRSGILGHPSIKSANQPTKKDIVVDPHNVASSSVKTSKIPVKCQRITSTAPSKEGTLQNALTDLGPQMENTQKSTDQLVLFKKSEKVTPKKIANLQGNTSTSRTNELVETKTTKLVTQEEHAQVHREDNLIDMDLTKSRRETQRNVSMTKEAQDRSRENLEEVHEIPAVQDISVEKAEKLEVTSKQRKKRFISNNEEDQKAEVVPNEPDKLTQDDPTRNLPTASESAVEEPKYVSPGRRKGVTPRRTMSSRFTSNMQEDDPTKIQPTAPEFVVEESKYVSPERLERLTPRRRMSRRFTLNVQEDDLTGIQPIEPESQVEDAIDVPFEDEGKVTPSRRKSRRSPLSTKEDNITGAEPTVSETQVVKAKEVTENSQKSRRSRTNNREEERRAADTTDSESQSVSRNQDAIFLKPVGVPVKKNKKTRYDTSSTAENTSDENEARPDRGSGGQSKKKKNSKTVADENKKNVEEAPNLRRSARERKVVDPCWWRGVIGPSQQQRNPSRDTSADSNSSSSTKKKGRGRQRLTMKENKSASKQKKVKKSGLTDEENSQKISTNNEVYNSVEPDNETDIPSTSTTSTKKRKKKQLLTIKKQTKPKKETKKMVNDKRKKNGEEMSNVAQSEDITDINERLTGDDDIKYTTNQMNNSSDSDNKTDTSKKQLPNMRGAESPSQQKKTPKNAVIEERNYTDGEINNVTDDNATDIHERLTDVYSTSEGSSSQRQAESWEIDSLRTASSCTEEWHLIDKIKKSIRQDTKEVYKIGDTLGFLAIAPGKKRYTVNNHYEVVYLKLEGTIRLIMEDVLYTELPDCFFIRKGVRAQLHNTGVGRALLLYILK